MIAAHPFTTSRETVLPLWSSSAQARRQAPDAGLTDLFLLLQGMIFTNIQLDDFKSVLARFEEKLMLEGTYIAFPLSTLRSIYRDSVITLSYLHHMEM